MIISTERIPRGKTQEEILTGKNKDDNNEKNAAFPSRRDQDLIKQIKIDIYDIDEAIMWYIKNKIDPYVMGKENSVVKVPVIYGSPEIWRTVSRDGCYRDHMGKLQLPLIMVRRTSVEENSELQLDKLDANKPRLHYFFYVKKTGDERLDRKDYAKLIDEKPRKEIFAVCVPQYVIINYEMILWTDYVEQMNKLIETFFYFNKAYWGYLEGKKFLTMVNNFSNTVEISEGDDRMVRTSCTLNVRGCLLPEILARDIVEKSVGVRRYLSPNKIIFETEIEI